MEAQSSPERETVATAGAVSRDEVHQALEALYDNVALARCAAVARFRQVDELEDTVQRALRLRAILLEAIELLRPARRAAFGSREARACDVLTLRYVERRGIPEMMEELSLGRRQVFRDLSQAEERLAAILSEWADAGDAPAPAASPDASLSDELAILASRPVEVSLREIMQEAVALVAPLARSLAVPLECGLPEGEEGVMADRAILKQVLVQTLSAAIQRSQPAAVKVTARIDAATASAGVLFRPCRAGAAESLAEVRQIAGHYGIRVEVSECRSACEVKLTLRRRQVASVLVVEDNPGAVELYRRYLSGGHWQLAHVSEPRLAYDTARRMRPDVIVLDIMMPHMDGWSVLQDLRQHEETKDVPVVLCSVVEDRELGRILGATACLKKPVSQGDFLAALQQSLYGRTGWR